MNFAPAFTFVCGAAVGVLVYDTALERHAPLPRVEQPRSIAYCTQQDAAGQALSASMVSSAAGTPSHHECLYR